MCSTWTSPRDTSLNVDLDMFDVVMLKWIRGHVDGGHIVTIYKCGGAKWSMKFLKKLTKPTTLNNSMGNFTVLGLCTRAGDSSLVLGGSRDKTVDMSQTYL
jgi:hypothetical protein